MKLGYAIAFVAGGIMGSATMYALLNKKYEKLMEEEIASVKEVFGRRTKQEKTETCQSEEKEDIKEVQREYSNIIQNSGYIEYPGKEIDETNDTKPYVIAPDEYGAAVGYDMVELCYFADGFLTDDYNELIENVEEIVGVDSLNHFGEYEADSVHVRNDKRRCDYEILKDLRKYMDIVKDKHSTPMEE
jgi:hypothetical protein